MRKKLFILIIILLVCETTKAQQKLRVYYSEIAKAENCVIQNDYKSAAKHYSKAFENKDFGFKRDLWNASYSEIMSGSPNQKNCMFYAEQIAKNYGNDIAWYWKNIENVDTIVFRYDKTLERKDNYFLVDSIRKMIDEDQSLRRTGNADYIRQADSINILEFKQLMLTYNMFDERVIDFDELNTLFNHWFLNFPDEQEFFLPLMKKAVFEGFMNAKNYADMEDIRFWRTEDSFMSPYGTKYLSIFRTNYKDRRKTDEIKYIAFSYFDKTNKQHKQWLKTTNKQRKIIYLIDVKTSAIRELKLFLQFNQETDFAKRRLFNYLPISMIMYENWQEEFENELYKNNKLQYFTNDNDIDIKHKRR
ncbi:MAG: hypothetical protein LBN95_03080 [Prevotellaceae bacterium]|jgi:hypothetical protein|nr:hypothetical protein [Prevotellaceae bacterium]